MSRVRTNRVAEFTEGGGVTIDDPRFASGPWIDPRSEDYEATGDGSTDDRAALAAADTAAALLGIGLLFTDGTYKVSSNLTISSRCQFMPGALLSPDTGITVTLSAGLFPTGPYQIFTGSGTVAFGAAAQPVVLPEWFAGATSGAKIKAALGALGSSGGTIDARSLVGAQTISADMFSGLTTKPVTLLFGPATYTVSAQQQPSSHTRIHLDGTTFIASTDQLQMWRNRTTSTTASVTNGNASITVASASEIDVGDLIGIFGHVPRGGRDNGTLSVAIDTDDTAVEVDATLYAALPSSGYIKINNELIRYSAKAGSNTLTVQTRGYGGTTAASHAMSDVVDRVVYEKYVVTAVSGTTVTLHTTVDCPTATAIDTVVGSSDIVFSGTGVIDGLKTSETDPGGTNAIGLLTQLARDLRTSRDIIWKRWDHGAIMLTASQDCVIDGVFRDTGRTASASGAAVWFFNNVTQCTMYGEYDHGNEGLKIDDRSSTATDWDNDCDDNVIHPRWVRDFDKGVSFAGTTRNHIVVPSAFDCATIVIGLEAQQWVTNPSPNNNYFELGATDSTSNAITMQAGYADGNNTIVVRQRGAEVDSPRLGNSYVMPSGQVDLSGGSVVLDLSMGDHFNVSATGNITFNAPTNVTPGRRFTIDLSADSGGVITTTFNAAFKMDTSWAAPANTKHRTVTFVSDGTSHYQIGAASEDI